MLAVAAASALHPGASPKLAGTALTLLGGAGGWLATRPDTLRQPLQAVRHALCSAGGRGPRRRAFFCRRECVSA